MRQRLMHAWFVMRRPMTLGARAIALDTDERVLLVKHTYIEGWYLPGGGIEPGETALDCVRREVAEEGNVTLGDEVSLFGLYFNANVSRRDHVALYVCPGVRHNAPKKPDREIAAAEFFALNALPHDLSPATRRRLDEWRGGHPPASIW